MILGRPSRARIIAGVKAIRPLRDNSIGPLIIAAAIVGFLVAFALFLYVATQT